MQCHHYKEQCILCVYIYMTSCLFLALVEFDHVVCNGRCYFICVPILAKVVHKSSSRIHQIHDDSVINLEWKRGDMKYWKHGNMGYRGMD